ncbi:MAG: HAD hydrolase-like protein, partial [Rhizobiaceae bacterium]
MAAGTPGAILFDLDGTLTDPFEGITLSIRHAMERLGRAAPAAEDLRWCIGPPLVHAFKVLLETQDETLAGRG